MLTDMTPTASQFYGSQIPAMGMNITNIANHMQKPNMNNVSAFNSIAINSFELQNFRMREYSTHSLWN